MNIFARLTTVLMELIVKKIKQTELMIAVACTCAANVEDVINLVAKTHTAQRVIALEIANLWIAVALNAT